MIKSIVEDEDLFPVFVSIGYDVYGLTEPLYWTDGLTINPDGSIDHEDDLEDMINEFRSKRSRTSNNSGTNIGDQNEGSDGKTSDGKTSDGKTRDYIDDDEDLDFSETIVGQKIHEFCERNDVSRDVTNYINFALVGVLDTFDPDDVNDETLINAAIDAGRFAARQVSKSGIDFSEDNTETVTNYELYDILVSEYDVSVALTKNVLGIAQTKRELKSSLGEIYSFMETYEPSLPDVVKTVSAVTGFQDETLARAAIRLKCGKISYNSLPEAAIISSLVFSDGFK